MDVGVREETPGDVVAVRRVDEEAFGRPQEARLVDLLRAGQAVLLSLVAIVDDRIVGHIVFSPVRLGSGGAELVGAGLGPMAVVPELQRRGIGSRLIAEGTRRLRARGCPFIVVLGHPGYYPRFGFVPASRHGVRCEWDVPDDAFLCLLLDSRGFRGMSGVVRYRDEFAMVT